MEIWKDIIGYNGKYKISNYGSVLSLKSSKPKVLKQTLKRGYLGVMLCENGNCKTIKVHRLVAKYFIPNPTNEHTVNHKDFNKANNHSDNLEWCTQQENVHHAIGNGKWGDFVKFEKDNKRRFIYMTTEEWEKKVEYIRIKYNLDSKSKAVRYAIKKTYDLER